MNNGLFISYALGRIYGGVIGGVISVVFLTWLVQTLSQQGVGAQNIASTLAELVVTIIFTVKSVVKWAADRPYKLLMYYAICMVVDIVVIFTCQSFPWLILGSSAVTVIGPNVFFQARTIMLNRVMASDELTLFRNRLDTIAIVSEIAGSGLGMITPVSLDMVGWLSIAFAVLVLQANVWQIRELEKLPRLKLE
jgi:hypothetical protein